MAVGRGCSVLKRFSIVLQKLALIYFDLRPAEIRFSANRGSIFALGDLLINARLDAGGLASSWADL